MQKNPEISVNISVYNGQEYLDESIQSILNQTFEDFECIIVDDGSTDRTSEILSYWEEKDKRVKVLHNPKNMGRPLSRNRAITVSKGSLIAVMDADDYAFPERLEKQFHLMHKNPEIQASGAAMLVYENDKRMTPRETNDEIRARLLFDCAIFHPTAIIRKSFLLSHKIWYDLSLLTAQDYGLWTDFLPHHDGIFYNLNDQLIRYRMHFSKNRDEHKNSQNKNANKVRVKILRYLGLPTTKENVNLHLALCLGNASFFGVSIDDCVRWSEQLIKKNLQVKLVNPKMLENYIMERIENILNYNELKKVLLDKYSYK